jgi:hypothetical protein
LKWRENVKKCSKCGEEKPESAFDKKSSEKSGITSRCKVCRSDDNRRYYRNNTEKINVTKRRYSERNRDKMRGYSLKFKYGMTIEDYNAMFERQSGVCAICKQPETARHSSGNGVLSLAVDHCHRTGEIRGSHKPE